MSRILIRADRVLTLRDRDDVLRKGAIIVADGKIEAVGPCESLAARGPFDEELGSLANDVAMPGLVSAHHHAGNNIRDGLEDIPLEMWLPLLFGSYRVGLTEEETYLRSLWSALELQRSGVTTVVDFHAPSTYLPRWGLPPCIQAYLDAGIRVSFGVSTRDQNPLVYGDHGELLKSLPKAQREWAEKSLVPADLDVYFRVFDDIYGEFNGKQGLVRVFLTPLGVQWASDALLKGVKRKAAEVGTGIQIHVIESRYQMMYGPRILGTSTIGHLKNIGFLGPEVSFAHCIWPSEEDIRMMADSGTAVLHNPTQNLKLASGICPVSVLRERGVRFAMGTDGSSFNDDNDLWTELRLGWFLARPPSINWESIPAREWMSRCIQEGNRIAMHDNLGSLEEGKTADIILLDGRGVYKDPDSHPNLDPWMVLLHRAQGGRDVHTVLTGGKVVRRKRKNVLVDEADVARRLRKVLRKRYQRLRKDKPFFAPIAEGIRRHFQAWEREAEVPAPRVHRYNRI
ncbi:MAG: amidohydrolase family protein [Candidatus Tectomicrobia bacterium]|nr:amidohydrolase family protein [Candidatus Tectomicrobia bacterium]